MSDCRIAHFDGLRRPLRVMVRAPRDPYPRRLPSAFSQVAEAPDGNAKASQAAQELAESIAALRAMDASLDAQAIRDRLCVASHARWREAARLAGVLQ